MRRHVNFDFVGRWRLWFAVSGAFLVVSLVSLATLGLNLSIDFTGGTAFTVSGISTDVDTETLEDVAAEAGAESATAQLSQEQGGGLGAIVRTEAVDVQSERAANISDALREAAGAEGVQLTFVGPTWGDRISAKMAQALVVFLVVVVLYISVRLEFKMSVAALVALVHDLVLTAGVYSIGRFDVSPATVIALLTILGYSLYDTVIVFDRVHENTTGLGSARLRYAQAVNGSMNDVLWRSVNTTITSGLPVAALLFIGSRALGAATLQDLALALFVGMLLGAYSSLFIASPVLALWKEREPKYARLAERAERMPDDEQDEASEPRPRKRQGPKLEPRGYVRGKGHTPRSKRG